jgi:transposase
MLRPAPLPAIPAETARIARAAFPKGHPYHHAADMLGEAFTDDAFAALFRRRGQPALAPWRLALATILQFAEGLSDRQAADAVRARLDWKYVLRLELDDAGFDASVLCEFRGRLVAGDAQWLLFETLLAWCQARQLLKARGQQRTDSTHVLAAVRALNRVEVVGETLRHALDSLAVAAPEWLRAHCLPAWGDRYARRVEDADLPKGQAAREAFAVLVGGDGHALLGALCAPDAPKWLREVPAVETLRRVWVQQYQLEDGAVRWRSADDIPPATVFIGSPYDMDAHYARKSTTSWVGYKVHLTEACDDEAPRLITHVETTTAPVVDAAALPAVHQALRKRDLLPAVQLVDSGYLDAPQIVASREEYQVLLRGPARPDYQWQARAQNGFALTDFRLDWAGERATCPAGHTSISWRERPDPAGRALIWVKFSSKDCGPCPCRPACCRAKGRSPRRTLCLRPQAQFEALQAARQRETTETRGASYATRAGIEGTLARGIRRCRLRRTRYRGRPKVHLGHILTATGLNFLRLGEWFAGTPRRRSRRSPFARLLATPLAPETCRGLP